MLNNASEAMITQVITVSENALIKEVLKQFVTHKISGLPIVTENNKVVGFISDGDLLLNIGHHNPLTFDIATISFTGVWFDQANLSQKLNELIQRNVMEIATHKVISVKPQTELGEVAEILGRKKIKKVPVIQDGRLVGIISRGDLLRFVASHYVEEL
jgi:CBS domain-containing protein